MIEALDLLLESKDRSSKKDVKQVKPTHADVGSEVTAEISTGKYRFVYRKRFHKKCETELTILAPQREQVTGDEAHDRVRAMLAETVDTGLWQAQRVLQATVDVGGRPVGVRRAVARARRRRRRRRRTGGVVGGRATADREDRRRIQPLLHRDRACNRGMGRRNRRVGGRRSRGRALSLPRSPKWMKGCAGMRSSPANSPR